MAYTYARTPLANGGVSLYLRPWSRSAAVVLLVLLSSAIDASGKELTFRNPRDLLTGEPAAFMELLEAARPAPVSMEDMGAILRALPPEGEVIKLGASAQKKVDAVRQLLKSTQRDWYEIKVIDLPQAAIVLHARAVVLISAPAIALVNAAELQAMAAHEIGHEYVWIEWNRARQRADRERLKELELVCDAIAAVTLRQLGMDPSKVIDGVEKVTRFNRERFGSATNEKSYPTLAERRAFAREIDRWLRESSWRSRSGLGRNCADFVRVGMNSRLPTASSPVATGRPRKSVPLITDRGAVRGRAEGALSVYLGIPYAAPPTGVRRFRPPEPHACWSGVLATTTYGNVCPQIPPGGAYFGDEDCLTLNVWSPRQTGQPLPVQVFFHGGGDLRTPAARCLGASGLMFHIAGAARASTERSSARGFPLKTRARPERPRLSVKGRKCFHCSRTIRFIRFD